MKRIILCGLACLTCLVDAASGMGGTTPVVTRQKAGDSVQFCGRLEDKKIPIIVGKLQDKTTLTKCNLSYCKIGDAGAIAIAEALEGNVILKILRLTGNNITSEGAKCLATVLKSNTTLIKLYFNDNRIGDEGAVAIAEALQFNPALKYINLENNGIGAYGAGAIGKTLRINSTLRGLRLGCNKIGVEGAKAISGAISDAPTWKDSFLRLASWVGFKSWNTSATNPNTTLLFLDLSYCGIGDAGIKALSEAIKSNPNTALICLILLGNKIGDEGAIAMVEALKSHPNRLTNLALAYNRISDVGAMKMITAIKTNPNVILTHLLLSENVISDRKRVMEASQKPGKMLACLGLY